ncbi:MAG TPA: 1-acyl-sn-glycerol-3-phosphate acyltransferase, partial [Thermoleophilaceae bacterium]|nr:1-acyl-sn-glycerol-3-phosphate acyltransferase [Thermoleophilaceae bacterium]
GGADRRLAVGPWHNRGVGTGGRSALDVASEGVAAAREATDPREDRSRAPANGRSSEHVPKAAIELREDLRRHLPGVEPERRLSDWGRSERIEGLVDRTLADFLYHHWFRCEVEGIENVPAAGGGLLVANHSGALAPDAAMIAKAIREEHPRTRPLNIAVERLFGSYPGLSMLLPKLGCVGAHPANVHRLLYDEESLVLFFPEGREGTRKLYKDRYRLRRFGRGEFVASARRAGVPIVPMCVVGAEEAAPTFAHLGLPRSPGGLGALPLTPTFPHLGPLGAAVYLPAKLRIRFLEPLGVDAGGDDRATVQTVAEEVRARIQETLFEMVAARDSVWY